jgi:DNA repair photolyase
MKKLISASRRTDLVSHFPDWLATALREERVRVLGPSHRVITADLSPDAVHTVVLWSKDFANLIRNVHGLRDALGKYAQTYFHFTITGLGGGPIEREVPYPSEALRQLPELVKIAGNPSRVSLRFDPIVYWREGDAVKSNLPFFETIANAAARAGVEDVRLSFTQWYGKSRRRARNLGFEYVDPPEARKLEDAARLAEIAGQRGIRLFSCSQKFSAAVSGIRASSCIDGRLLRELHPRNEEVSTAKDKSQRPACGCTESVDIGSYTQTCPHSCLYCYANPKV